MLEINNLTVKFADKKILDSFSIDLSDYNFIALFGPSGCGKTTLLNVIAGINKKYDGYIKNDHIPVYMFQEPRLFPYLTALENVNVVLSDNKDTLEMAKEFLLKVGFSDFDKFPDELSGGMKQRVSLARTLAGNGDLLLLDEPFSALDNESKKDLFKVLREDGRKVIFVTHNIADLGYADKIVYF